MRESFFQSAIQLEQCFKRRLNLKRCYHSDLIVFLEYVCAVGERHGVNFMMILCIANSAFN